VHRDHLINKKRPVRPAFPALLAAAPTVRLFQDTQVKELMVATFQKNSEKIFFGHFARDFKL